MRIITRLFIFVLGASLLLWLFRGPIYRWSVHYRVVDERASVPALTNTTVKVHDLASAIQMALDTTATRLHFSTGKVTNDPGMLIQGSPANCIGYAALCAALVKGHLANAGLGGRFSVVPVVSKLYIMEWDLHTIFRSPFWKDHDVVSITDSLTGEILLLDPTLYDVFGVARVSMILPSP